MTETPRRRPALPAGGILALLGLAVLGGCGETTAPAASSTIRLVDRFEDREATTIEHRVEPRRIDPLEWRFDGGAGATDWAPGPGLESLEVRDGLLAGRTDDDFPVIVLERTRPTDPDDLLHSVEVRLRVSAGADLAVQFAPPGDLDLEGVVAQGRLVPWRIATPVIAGPEPRTYVLSAEESPFSTPGAGIGHVLVRPTDAAGADFEIESVRLVFRRDHLSSIPSGVSWQGLSEIYHETLVARAPERLSFALDLPENARLELSVGTIEDEPVSFRIAARPLRASAETERVLAERTVTGPGRWEPVTVDLGEHAGQRVALTLGLEGAREGALGFWGSPAIHSAPQAPPPAVGLPQGVILVLADTLRRDHLGTYGYGRDTDPTLQRLAAEGALFRDAQVEATWTKASAPSIFASLHPLTHGVLDFEHRLPASAVTLAEVYREAGHSTLLLSSIIFTGKFSNLHQGFQEVHESASLAERRSSKTAAELVDRLIPWLERRRSTPFFVVLHVLDPHDPYRPKPPYDGLWADRTAAEEHERRAREVRAAIADPLLQVFGMPSRDEVAAAGFDPESYIDYEMDWYDGAIRGLDDALGRLVDFLREGGLAERTVIAFTSDHGEEFFDHGRMFHGQSLYGELTNVPLVLWGPDRIPAGAVVERTVQTIDLMPTLLELSGLPVPEAAQGRSLLPLARTAAGGGGARRRPVFSTRAATHDLFGPPPRAKEAYSVILGEWKLIHNLEGAEGDPEFELYHHASDPLALRDVAARHPEVVERLSGVLERWRRETEARRLPPDEEAAAALTGPEIERLRSLGYID
jgi:arylsulfatase A-like enzyme